MRFQDFSGLSKKDKTALTIGVIKCSDSILFFVVIRLLVRVDFLTCKKVYSAAIIEVIETTTAVGALAARKSWVGLWHEKPLQ